MVNYQNCPWSQVTSILLYLLPPTTSEEQISTIPVAGDQPQLDSWFQFFCPPALFHCTNSKLINELKHFY